MHTRFRFVLACLALLAAAPAGATTYYYCYMTDYYKNELVYFTPIMSTSVEDVDEYKTAMAFYDEFSDQLLREHPGVAGSFQPHCLRSSKLGYVQDTWKGLPTSWKGPGRQVAFTNPPVPSAPVEDKGPVSAALIIEKTGPTPAQQARDAARAQAEADRARQVARDNADRAAVVAAKNAAYDAKWGPILEAERARRRQCPSCQ